MHEIVTAKDNTMSSKNSRRSSSGSAPRYTKDGQPMSVKRAKQLRTALYVGMAFVAVLLLVWLFYDL